MNTKWLGGLLMAATILTPAVPAFAAPQSGERIVLAQRGDDNRGRPGRPDSSAGRQRPQAQAPQRQAPQRQQAPQRVERQRPVAQQPQRAERQRPVVQQQRVERQRPVVQQRQRPVAQQQQRVVQQRDYRRDDRVRTAPRGPEIRQDRGRVDPRRGSEEYRRDNRDDNRRYNNDRRYDDNRRYDNDRRYDDNRRNDNRRYDNDHRYDNNRNYNNNRNWNNRWRDDDRYDWRNYRQRYSNHYRMPRYYSPYRGYNYTRFSIGFNLWPNYYGQQYWINDPWEYRLPDAYGSYRWVRYYDDVLLVDVRNGRVVDVIHDFFY